MTSATPLPPPQRPVLHTIRAVLAAPTPPSPRGWWCSSQGKPRGGHRRQSPPKTPRAGPPGWRPRHRPPRLPVGRGKRVVVTIPTAQHERASRRGELGRWRSKEAHEATAAAATPPHTPQAPPSAVATITIVTATVSPRPPHPPIRRPPPLLPPSFYFSSPVGDTTTVSIMAIISPFCRNVTVARAADAAVTRAAVAAVAGAASGIVTSGWNRGRQQVLVNSVFCLADYFISGKF